jgi:hypothetical protein
MPHNVQESEGEDTGAGEGGGDTGGAAGITCGLISPSLAPQTPQIISSCESGLLQEPQVRLTSGTAAGGGLDGDSSSCDAPQFRQNFAVGATRLPHSGQYDMIITLHEVEPAFLRALLQEKTMKGKFVTHIRPMTVFVVATGLNLPHEWSDISFYCHRGLLQPDDECST